MEGQHRKNKMEARDNQADRPPLTFKRVAVQLIAGGVGTGAGYGIAALLTIAIMELLLGPSAGLEAWSIVVGVFSVIGLPLLLGLPTVGGAAGVYLVSNRGVQTGSFRWALAGSILQQVVIFIAAILLMRLIPYLNPSGTIPRYLLSAVEILGRSLFIVPAGAVIGFNLTRRYSTGASTAPAG